MSGTMFQVGDREITPEDLEVIREIITMFPNLSRHEMAATIGEAIGLVTHTNQPRTDLCLQLLDQLEEETDLKPPAPKKQTRRKPQKQVIRLTAATEPRSPIETSLSELGPVRLQPVLEKTQRTLWKEYIERYHPLKFTVAFGAQQSYFIRADDEYLGCFLFSASAWALMDRDNWIGWTEEDRAQRLHLVVNNSRFLIFPWVKVKNLASKALGLVTRRLPADWLDRYGYSPVLLETFVDMDCYDGICYRAANWRLIGETKGRGRMDRYSQYLSNRKHIYMYPLRPDFRRVLRGKVAP